MTKLVDLYKGKCVEDLDQHYKLPSLKEKKIDQLISSATRLYDEGLKYEKVGDEELAFIFYMKYLGVITSLQNSPEFSINKKLICQLVGANDRVNIAINKAEYLKASLIKRYNILNQINNSLDSSFVSQSESSSDEMEVGIIIEKKNNNTIDCISLYKMMMEPNIYILILDCRLKDEFKASKILYKNYLNIAEEYLTKGMTPGKLQQRLEPEFKNIWSTRLKADYIILLDWNTKESDLVRNPPVNNLKYILLNYDDRDYENNILIVDGGYEKFAFSYPMLCHNPDYVPVRANKDDVNQMIDEIEYPSINDITMKDSVASFRMDDNNRRNNKIPSIDRKSKIDAVLRYEQEELSDVFHAQEALAEKALETSRKLLNSEQDWKKNELMRESGVHEKSRNYYNDKEQEYIYQILQLENMKNDVILAYENLRRREEEYESKVKLNELSELDRVKRDEETKRQKRIEDKKHEDERVNRQRNILKEERERKLVIAREQKRHLLIDKTNEENIDIPKSKQPQFDRSVKPVIVNLTDVTQRDFAPEYGGLGSGLTGLKNLGNTCYMNSIIQCLNNTIELSEYFISNEYQNHINRSNLTQGKVVDEVSAVVKVLWNGNYKYISCKNLRYVIGQFNNMFRGYDQHDSHEFLTILMDWLHSDLQTVYATNTFLNKDKLSSSEKAWQDFLQSKESYILKLFYGQIKSTVKCVSCKNESATYESFSNLSLELPQCTNRTCDIEDCLDMYFSGERITGWNCSSCRDKRDAIKKLDISKLPPILVIHFKRFYADMEFPNVYRKKQNYINFPLNELDVKNYVSRSVRSNGIKLYNLYGVSNHYGTMDRGHYTAFCKNNTFQKWYKFDDHIVTNLDTSDVVSSGAYILFYTTFPFEPRNEINKSKY